jgi:hypothetical protein
MRTSGHARRDFLAQGFLAGSATVVAPTIFSLFANPGLAMADLSPDLLALKTSCGLDVLGARKIPFICIDLAGGANMAGSNVLIGGPGGQLDFLTTAGYGKLGLPGDMIPPLVNPVTNTSFTDTRLGLAFHSDSAFLRGIIDRISPATAASINGAVIAARSENDTGNNPHNPMYGINRAGANGELLTLIGSRASDSGGNSMAPAGMIDLSVRPTKIDRASDVRGLVDTGQLVGLLGESDTVAVLESVQRISARKIQQVDSEATVAGSQEGTGHARRGHPRAGELRLSQGRRHHRPVRQSEQPRPDQDPDIVGPGGVFTQARVRLG